MMEAESCSVWLRALVTKLIARCLLPVAALRAPGRARWLACQWALGIRFPAEDLEGLSGPARAAFTCARADAFWRHGQLIGLTSGHRDAAEQHRMFTAEVRRTGSRSAARRRVLPPEESAHVAGVAVDVRPTDGARWLERYGHRYHLYRRYDNEWWHFEYRPEYHGQAPPLRPHPGAPDPSVCPQAVEGGGRSAVAATAIASPHAYAVVHLDAVAHNTALLAAGTNAAVMAVVKADGFGHGAVRVAGAALSAGATWLGVTTCAEALQLRAGGIAAPILSWMHSPLEDIGAALLANVDLSVSSREHLCAVAASAARLGITAEVHLKADTGLHRNGARPEEWRALVRLARDLETTRQVRVRGVWSHLISGTRASEDTTRSQVKLFDRAVAIARAAGLRPEIRHLANSAATLGAPQTHYELVRPGIGLYGVEPDPGHVFGLRAAMTLRARLILIKRVPAGSGVSYEHDYVTDRDTTLALVPLGYADGLPWIAARHAEVSIAGRRYPVAGRIAMDQFVVDVGDATPQLGDEAVVFGPGTDAEPTVSDWARWANTVPHEILTGIGPRVARHYVHTGARRTEEPRESSRV